MCNDGYAKKMKKAVKQLWVTSLYLEGQLRSVMRTESLKSLIKESEFNKEKCEIKKESPTYFEHVFSADRLSPDPEKVKAISELQTPMNVPELRRVIVVINYLGRFVPNLATIMQPMTDLLKSNRA